MSDDNVSGLHWSFWAIGAVTLIYNLAGVMNFITQLNPDNVAAMPEGYRMIIDARPIWATASFAVAVIGGAAGCILLLTKKSASYLVFIAALVGSFLTMIDVLTTTTPLGFKIGNLTQIVVTLFLVWYAKWTTQKAGLVKN